SQRVSVARIAGIGPELGVYVRGDKTHAAVAEQAIDAAAMWGLGPARIAGPKHLRPDLEHRAHRVPGAVNVTIGGVVTEHGTPGGGRVRPQGRSGAAGIGSARTAAGAVGFREEYRVRQAVDKSRAELAVALDAARVGACGSIAFGIAKAKVVKSVVAD